MRDSRPINPQIAGTAKSGRTEKTREFSVSRADAGYLGRFHAQKYAALPDVDLVCVVDSDPDRAAAMGAELGVPHTTSLDDLPGRVDLASVATPTVTHHAVTLPLLAAGIHVLVEKPITSTETEARELLQAAEKAGVLLQVGHLERFNPAVQTLREEVRRPLFVEAHRLSRFSGRATDVDIVRDLMIHDLDILLSLVKAPLVEIRATGVPVVTPNVDLANARLSFADGCTANLTASRLSFKDMRRFRVIHTRGYVVADCASRQNQIFRKPAGAQDLALPQEVEHGPADNLLAEIRSFVRAIRQQQPAAVSGLDGLNALQLALKINQTIAEEMEKHAQAKG